MYHLLRIQCSNNATTTLTFRKNASYRTFKLSTEKSAAPADMEDAKKAMISRMVVTQHRSVITSTAAAALSENCRIESFEGMVWDKQGSLLPTMTDNLCSRAGQLFLRRCSLVSNARVQ